MSERQLHVKVFSPSAPMADLKAKGVIVPGILGYLEVLPNHTSLVSEIAVGVLTLEQPDPGSGNVYYFVAGGYLEVDSNEVMVLVDIIEMPEEINRERAEKARERAVERLTTRDPRFDLGRAQQALRRAHGRLAFLDTVAFNRKS